MTEKGEGRSDDVKSELDKEPFRPLRLHLASGKTFDIVKAGTAFMLQNAVMVLRRSADDEYDLLSLRNIERIEPLGDGARPRGRRKG